MAGNKKRKRSRKTDEGDQKRQKVSGGFNSKDPIVKHALLRQYYHEVSSLREYLLAKLPAASKIRRKKIISVGRKSEDKDSDQKICRFLDNTLIGVRRNGDFSQDERWHQWTTFSQKSDESISFANLSTAGVYSQSEIIDFCIWLMFFKSRKSNGRVQHLLCQGFQKDVSARHMNWGENATSAIQGVISTYPNDHVTSMKAWPWPQVLALFGKQGEKMMIDLILDCGIFVPVENVHGSYSQLGGQPLGELQILGQRPQMLSIKKMNDKPIPRAPSTINFVRSRMMYARASTNVRGDVHFGFRHNHLLNRWPLKQKPSDHDQQNAPRDRSTIQVLMYMFPRQFGLHNVFTDEVDSRQTMQPFQDYTLRDEEIVATFPGDPMPKVPKRLRGKALLLARRLQINHRRCSYKMLLDHYCPVPGTSRPSLTQNSQSTNGSAKLKSQKSAATAMIVSPLDSVATRNPSMIDNATPTTAVSAFCRAVLDQLVPLSFLGSGNAAKENRRAIDQNIDAFVQLQRFANFSLHHVSQSIKISSIEWLGPLHNSGSKLPQSDTQKRWEIFHEFLYYLFDSLLIPLIRANFHVTESNIHGSRLFYFRHDVWRTLTEPALTSLKSTMFEEIKLKQALKLLERRVLGYSQVRLVPKETGVRPIMNLRRRQPAIGSKNRLGSSINTVLAPVYNILTLERSLNPERLGSTMFSTGDLYQRLKVFKSQLTSTDKLYFAKVDVQAAFDTIPQAAVVALISSVPSESEYRISKHVQIKPGDAYRETGQGKPIIKWTALAKSLDDLDTFEEHLESDLAIGKRHTIFVENVVSQFKNKDELLDLLAEHVQQNMVKIGNKFYRQKEGIPQGSVISSLLCNYFYADLEAKHLSFLQCENTLLLRLIDDFLLITTNRSYAKRFLQTMHDGLPSYGVRVNPDKTLVNFEVTINNKKVPRMVGRLGFPYCGSFIDTKSLDITRDRDRRKNKAIVDSLTVEFSKTPGRMFHRKILNTFKIQAHAMFLDTSFNSLKTVLSNAYSAFIESATKMWTYAKCLPSGKQPGTELLLKTIQDLIELAFVLMKSKGKNRKNVGYKCALTKIQVEWLALNAFEGVLRKRQSKYIKVLEWLDGRMGRLRLREAETCKRMQGVLKTAQDE